MCEHAVTACKVPVCEWSIPDGEPPISLSFDGLGKVSISIAYLACEWTLTHSVVAGLKNSESIGETVDGRSVTPHVFEYVGEPSVYTLVGCVKVGSITEGPDAAFIALAATGDDSEVRVVFAWVHLVSHTGGTGLCEKNPHNVSVACTGHDEVVVEA